MAGLISTSIWGYLCSATEKAGKRVETFVSAISGWKIWNDGAAEFKSIYARDKIITNEYVYNRIKVTEDEEVITSSIKILSAVDNGNGTWTIYPDLREGDINPLAGDDLLQGYYHATGNTDVIYAVQRFTAIENPNTEDQSITVTPEEDHIPYQHMIIVRVGNKSNVERQSFIKISSRTNCQYFFDEITSFADLDNPDKVKLVLGKADIGLIPDWATQAIGELKRWFGLIADGVILRGIFILKSSGKTIETELGDVNQTITDVETRFEVREGQISSKVEETKTYAKNASGSASAAANSAAASEDAKVISEQKASEAIQTVEGFESTVTETTKKAVTDAVTGATELIEEKVGTAVTQSAREWKVEVLNGEDTVLASINADESGVQIKGDKVQITGTLLAQIILATGLNISDKFIVTVVDGVATVKVYGEINAEKGNIGGMNIVGNSLRGVQAVMGKYMHQISGNNSESDRNIIVNNITKQQIYLFSITDVAQDVIVNLPSHHDMILNGIEEYQFEITLMLDKGSVGSSLLLKLNDDALIVHGIKEFTRYGIGRGGVLRLLYFQNRYYLVSSSEAQTSPW